MNRLDQGEFVRLLNQQFGELSRQGAFATAIVTTFFSPSRRLTICNAGHPRPLLYRAATKQWELLTHQESEGPNKAANPSNLPLGIFNVTEYEQFDVELEPGDCVVSYTDALSESNDRDNEMLGEAGLLRIMSLLGDVEPHALIETFLGEITQRNPQNLSDDDVTVLVVRANGRVRGYSMVDKLLAAIRFAGSLIRAVNPHAERPPFPDLNLANIGGAIIPVLGRRWRASSARRKR